jgi:hypothetical protein
MTSGGMRRFAAPMLRSMTVPAGGLAGASPRVLLVEGIVL